MTDRSSSPPSAADPDLSSSDISIRFDLIEKKSEIWKKLWVD